MDIYFASTVVKLLLQKDGYVSYRTLQQQLGVSATLLEELQHELVEFSGFAKDQNGKGLVLAAPPPGKALAFASPPRENADGWSASTDHPLDGHKGGAPFLARTQSEAERRQLTVMFADLVGSTALSTQMDPEDLRDVITSFQDECRDAIERYDGFIARYMGDGMLVYFGYPQAHENDAERAARAGLGIIESMSTLNTQMGCKHDILLSVRVGIATGPVVVGDLVGEGAAEEAAVVGETPNLAARLQGVAQPDQLVISTATRRILDDLFTFDDLGTHDLKGIPQPVQAWQVTGAVDVEGRHEARRQMDSSPLVGREEELGLLLRAWDGACEGRGQVVSLQGEPGVGKSRLLEALREPLGDDSYTWVSIRCSPYHASTSLYPVIEHFKRVMHWQPEDDPSIRLAKLEVALRTQSSPLEEVVPLFAELMSLSIPEDSYPALSLSPRRKREATLDAIVGWALEITESKPVLQVWEDLHWADPTTLELLGLYIEQSPTVSMLNVLTCRPDFSAPWSNRSHITPITLNRLERPEVEAIVNNLTRGKALPDEVLEHIVAKADGVPLYVEELTKTILESAVLQEQSDRFLLDGTLAELQIPSTLQDSLMSRLDRVPALREVAQVAAVLGREFRYQMLELLADLDEKTLQEMLGQLVAEELLYQRGRPPRSRYIFKHALIQDAAYQSLLKRGRQAFHRRIAEMLESVYPELVAAQPELVAHHYGESGQAQEAFAYWAIAGTRAMDRWATGEAVNHFRAGLKMLEALPASAQRDRSELEIQTALGPALMASRGFGDPALLDTYRRAAQLCESAGDHEQICLMLRGQQIYHFALGDLEQSCDIARQLLTRADEAGNDDFKVGGSHALGQSLFIMGNFTEAKKVIDTGIHITDSAPFSITGWPGGQPAEQCQLYAGFVNWMLGFPDRAREQAERGLSWSEAADNPVSLLNSEAFVASIYVLLRDGLQAQAHAARTVTLCEEHHHPTFLPFGGALHGAAQAMQGRLDAGIDEMERAIANYYALDIQLWVPMMLVPLADAYGRRDQCAEGLAVLARKRSSSEHAWDAELKRVQGLLLSHEPSQMPTAVACLQDALRIARQQQARSLELRAATGLARIWSNGDKVREARELLEPVYNWFTEGFGTPDLIDARELLDAIG